MSSTSQRKTLVTGGAGFIGSHLVDLLLRKGHRVMVIDNLSTGREENLAHQKQNENLDIVYEDISNLRAISHAFQEVDWVFHLASLADIVASIERPLDYHHANVDGTVAVLEAARQYGVKRFIYAASSSCYGIPEVYPTPESAPLRPMYPYALTKTLGEHYVLHWNQVYKIPCISLRLFNVFGPRSRTTGTYGAVFGVFLAQKIAGKPFTVVGNGNQTRDFTFVSDVVQAFLDAAESTLQRGIFNVGSGGTYQINRLVDLLGGDVVHIPKRPGEPDCTFADTGRIRAELKWKPRISFEDGVKIMMDHILDWKEAPLWDERSIEHATRDWFRYLGDDERSKTPWKSNYESIPALRKSEK